MGLGDRLVIVRLRVGGDEWNSQSRSNLTKSLGSEREFALTEIVRCDAHQLFALEDCLKLHD